MKQWNSGIIGSNKEKQHAYLFRITGRVQGVCYRAEAKEKADALGLTGWVRNCEDGSVEIFAQGAEAAIKGLGDWCREGPPGARVKAVERRDAAPTKEAGFSIRS